MERFKLTLKNREGVHLLNPNWELTCSTEEEGPES